jgi:hypothetical protein
MDGYPQFTLEKINFTYLPYAFCVSELTCPSPNGYFAHPCDCTKFLQCAGGTLYEQNCHQGLHFDVKNIVCDKPENVNCMPGGHRADVFDHPDPVGKYTSFVKSFKSQLKIDMFTSV